MPNHARPSSRRKLKVRQCIYRGESCCCRGSNWLFVVHAVKAFRAEKLALQRELGRAREAEAAMRDEAEVHTVQLEALLAVKRALAAEVGARPRPVLFKGRVSACC